MGPSGEEPSDKGLVGAKVRLELVWERRGGEDWGTGSKDGSFQG